MELKELQQHWDRFGRKDPLWAIVAWPEKKGNKWQLDEFFETGVREIAAVVESAEGLNIDLKRRRALDFGCGVGRLTQALANHFDEVVGVDIAPSMVKLARKYNRHGSKCTYHLNETDDLRLFPDETFDFVYTNIVLQHMLPVYAKSYIREFLRVPGSQRTADISTAKRTGSGTRQRDTGLFRSAKRGTGRSTRSDQGVHQTADPGRRVGALQRSKHRARHGNALHELRRSPGTAPRQRRAALTGYRGRVCGSALPGLSICSDEEPVTITT